jgi:hypothetical protein
MMYARDMNSSDNAPPPKNDPQKCTSTNNTSKSTSTSTRTRTDDDDDTSQTVQGRPQLRNQT